MIVRGMHEMRGIMADENLGSHLQSGVAAGVGKPASAALSMETRKLHDIGMGDKATVGALLATMTWSGGHSVFS